MNGAKGFIATSDAFARARIAPEQSHAERRAKDSFASRAMT